MGHALGRGVDAEEESMKRWVWAGPRYEYSCTIASNVLIILPCKTELPYFLFKQS